jgi:hypothetical protein
VCRTIPGGGLPDLPAAFVEVLGSDTEEGALTVKSRCKQFFLGKWTGNRLMSRKWWLTLSVIYVAIAADLTGHALSAETLDFVQHVAVPWLGIQGAVDIYQIRQSVKNRDSEDIV